MQDMRHRLVILRRHIPVPPRYRRWRHHLIAKLISIAAIVCAILVYGIDATAQNLAGQFGDNLLQAIMAHAYMFMEFIWLYAIIAFLVLIIICLIVGFIKQRNKMRQQRSINRIDEYLFNQLPRLMHPDEEGESHEN